MTPRENSTIVRTAIFGAFMLVGLLDLVYVMCDTLRPPDVSIAHRWLINLVCGCSIIVNLGWSTLRITSPVYSDLQPVLRHDDDNKDYLRYISEQPLMPSDIAACMKTSGVSVLAGLMHLTTSYPLYDVVGMLQMIYGGAVFALVKHQESLYQQAARDEAEAVAFLSHT